MRPTALRQASAEREASGKATLGAGGLDAASASMPRSALYSWSRPVLAVRRRCALNPLLPRAFREMECTLSERPRVSIAGSSSGNIQAMLWSLFVFTKSHRIRTAYTSAWPREHRESWQKPKQVFKDSYNALRCRNNLFHRGHRLIIPISSATEMSSTNPVP
jgi:hypothetical protein